MDPVHFTGKEVLDMAVKIEENGLKFYTDAGKTAKDKDVKALFKAIAEDEGRHIRVFQDLKKLLGETENAEPFDEETESYLRAFADTEVFASPEGGKKLGKEVSSEAEAIDFAIGMEKDSILFYYEILKMIREKDKAVVDTLIDQEKDHLKRLTVLRAGL